MWLYGDVHTRNSCDSYETAEDYSLANSASPDRHPGNETRSEICHRLLLHLGFQFMWSLLVCLVGDVWPLIVFSGSDHFDFVHDLQIAFANT